MKHNKYLIYFLACLAFSGASQIYAQSQITDWKKTYSDDLAAARTTIADNHPGMIDKENPSFAAAMNSAYREALNTAQSVSDYNSYRFALMRFVNRFQDGHLSISFQKPFENIKEAGVFTSFQNGGFVVRSVDERYGAAGENLTGAKLVGCDRLPANAFFRESVLSWRGRPAVQADWYRFAPAMFVDYSPANSSAPKNCRFLKNGKTIALPFRWNDTTGNALNEKIQKIFSSENHSLNLERLADGKVLWVNLPTFNVNTPEQISLMKNLIDSFKNELKENKNRNLIVFDLRGNDGGSSSWGNQFAAALFGADWMSRAEKWLGDGVYTEWRASPDNLQSLEGIVKQQERRHGAYSPTLFYFQKLHDLMNEGLKNKTSFITTDDRTKSAIPKPEKAAVPEKIVVLTSPSCFSACLDFLDVMLANPAVLQVGQITGVDTVYMESWSKKLPSGLAQIGYPMKVYRNRRRGNNQAYTPDVRYNGELNDTAKVQSWILQNHSIWQASKLKKQN